MIKEFLKYELFKKAKTDEEYRKYLISKNRINYLICGVGVITLIVAVVRLFTVAETKEAFTCGVFAGTGGVILAVGGGAIWKAKKLMKDAKKLREERLKTTDERNSVILQKTTYLSSTILLSVCYLALLISCFFNMIVFWTLWGVLMSYFVLAMIIKKYYEKQL